MPVDPEALSRTVSHALRHEPATYRIELDARGSVPVADLLAALRAWRPAWRNLAETDLLALVDRGEKRRFAVEGGRMRALYGHSLPDVVERDAATPPATLYHGTGPRQLDLIFADGLRPGQRHHVHLSADAESAFQVARRHALKPVILTVDAAGAHAAGVTFYDGGNGVVWLADHVPAAHLRRP